PLCQGYGLFALTLPWLHERPRLDAPRPRALLAQPHFPPEPGPQEQRDSLRHRIADRQQVAARLLEHGALDLRATPAINEPHSRADPVSDRFNGPLDEGSDRESPSDAVSRNVGVPGARDAVARAHVEWP